MISLDFLLIFETALFAVLSGPFPFLIFIISLRLKMEEENVQVVIRIRPMQTDEKKNGDIPCVTASGEGRHVQVKVGPLDGQSYKCNRCFSPETNQVSFFNESGITDLLDSASEGYRACAFAFGNVNNSSNTIDLRF